MNPEFSSKIHTSILLKVSDSHYVWIDNMYGDFECKSLEAMMLVSDRLEIPRNELELAMTDLIRENHNLAEFGMNRTFMYSRKA